MLGHSPTSTLAVSTMPRTGTSIPPPPGPSPFGGTPAPIYELIEWFDTIMPGMVFTKADWDAMYAAWKQLGFPKEFGIDFATAYILVKAEHGPLPAPVTSIRRFDLEDYDAAPTIMNPWPGGN
jgi:hypothetical protein